MSSNKFNSFKELRKGKYDWKVQARVLNMWRGYSKLGDPFKGFNLLLLDNKRDRMHAFVPGTIAEECEKIIQVGNIYLIENFTVKDYKQEEKFRCIRKNFQIIFSTDTNINPVEENEVSIEKCWFDYYDLADLKHLAKQNTYLTDVIGVMEDHDPIGRFKNKNGAMQSKINFNITDGRTSVKVAFWDEFAELFADTIKGDLEYPRILIIGSCRITMWGDEIIISNVGATTFYINTNHHSVIELRKMISQPLFSKYNFKTASKRAAILYKVQDIKEMGDDHIETHVFCQVQITVLQQMKKWCHHVCSSCYNKTNTLENVDICSSCSRIVPHAYRRFEIEIIAFDETGEIKIMLEDREVRTLIGKPAQQLIDEGNNEEIWPDILNTIKDKDYTVKLKLTDANIQKISDLYVATDIMQGLFMEMNQEPQQSYPQPIDSMEPQASGSTYYLGSES